MPILMLKPMSMSKSVSTYNHLIVYTVYSLSVLSISLSVYSLSYGFDIVYGQTIGLSIENTLDIGPWPRLQRLQHE